MATPKTKSPAKPKPAPTNTSTAQPGNDVDVSATGAAQAAPQASHPQAGQQSSEETTTVPPVGAKKANEPVAKALIVTAKADGFRRAGRRWSTAEQTVSIDEFTTEQVEALLGEPMLDVVVVVA